MLGSVISNARSRLRKILLSTSKRRRRTRCSGCTTTTSSDRTFALHRSPQSPDPLKVSNRNSNVRRPTWSVVANRCPGSRCNCSWPPSFGKNETRADVTGSLSAPETTEACTVYRANTHLASAGEARARSAAAQTPATLAVAAIRRGSASKITLGPPETRRRVRRGPSWRSAPAREDADRQDDYPWPAERPRQP